MRIILAKFGSLNSKYETSTFTLSKNDDNRVEAIF